MTSKLYLNNVHYITEVVFSTNTGLFSSDCALLKEGLTYVQKKKATDLEDVLCQ